MEAKIECRPGHRYVTRKSCGVEHCLRLCRHNRFLERFETLVCRHVELFTQGIKRVRVGVDECDQLHFLDVRNHPVGPRATMRTESHLDQA